MTLRCSVLYCQADSRRLCFVVLSSFQRADAPDCSTSRGAPPATNISVWGTLQGYHKRLFSQPPLVSFFVPPRAVSPRWVVFPGLCVKRRLR